MDYEKTLRFAIAEDMKRIRHEKNKTYISKIK